MLITSLLTNDRVLLENRKDLFLRTSPHIIDFEIMCHTPSTDFYIYINGTIYYSGYMRNAGQYNLRIPLFNLYAEKVCVDCGDSDVKISAIFNYDLSKTVSVIKRLFI